MFFVAQNLPLNFEIKANIGPVHHPGGVRPKTTPPHKDDIFANFDIKAKIGPVRHGQNTDLHQPTEGVVQWM